MTWVLIAVAGAAGAVCRYVLDTAVSARLSGRFPWGTLVVNVSGSLLAGLTTGLTMQAVVDPTVHLVVAGGFLGAYTTFSTTMYESLLLLEEGDRTRGLVNLLAGVVASVAAAVTGLLLVS